MSTYDNNRPGWYPSQNYTDKTPPRAPGSPENSPGVSQEGGPPVNPLGPGGRPYASFLDRFLGLLIDSLILAVPIGVVLLVLIGPTIIEAVNDPVLDPETVNMAIPTVSLIIAVALIHGVYFVVGLHKFGRTIGGRVMGIRCVDAEGNHPTWGASFIRWGVVEGFNLLTNVPVVGLFAFPLLIINYLAMLWSPKKQCWMDIAAKTYVIKSN